MTAPTPPPPPIPELDRPGILQREAVRVINMIGVTLFALAAWAIAEYRDMPIDEVAIAISPIIGIMFGTTEVARSKVWSERRRDEEIAENRVQAAEAGKAQGRHEATEQINEIFNRNADAWEESIDAVETIFVGDRWGN